MIVLVLARAARCRGRSSPRRPRLRSRARTTPAHYHYYDRYIHYILHDIINDIYIYIYINDIYRCRGKPATIARHGLRAQRPFRHSTESPGRLRKGFKARLTGGLVDLRQGRRLSQSAEL